MPSISLKGNSTNIYTWKCVCMSGWGGGGWGGGGGGGVGGGGGGGGGGK